MAAEYRTPEAQAVRKHTSQLTRAIQDTDLPWLSSGFFSEAMVSSDLMESVSNPATADRAVRCNKLLLAVMANLEDHPDKFECVLEILSQEPTLCTVAERVAKTCGELMCSMCRLATCIKVTVALHTEVCLEVTNGFFPHTQKS